MMSFKFLVALQIPSARLGYIIVLLTNNQVDQVTRG